MSDEFSQYHPNGHLGHHGLFARCHVMEVLSLDTGNVYLILVNVKDQPHKRRPVMLNHVKVGQLLI